MKATNMTTINFTLLSAVDMSITNPDGSTLAQPANVMFSGALTVGSGLQYLASAIGTINFSREKTPDKSDVIVVWVQTQDASGNWVSERAIVANQQHLSFTVTLAVGERILITA